MTGIDLYKKCIKNLEESLSRLKECVMDLDGVTDTAKHMEERPKIGLDKNTVRVID